MKDIEILATKAHTFLRTDEAEDLLNAAQDFVRKVQDYLDKWAEQK